MRSQIPSTFPSKYHLNHAVGVFSFFFIFYFSILLAREFQPAPSFLSQAHSHFVWLFGILVFNKCEVHTKKRSCFDSITSFCLIHVHISLNNRVAGGGSKEESFYLWW